MCLHDKYQINFFSSGVGLTGTFIALDILVEQANVEKQVQPFKTVKRLRNQRPNMVQTKVHQHLNDTITYHY